MKKTILNAAVAVALGSAGVMSTASAGTLTFTFADGTGAAGQPMSAGNEFRVTTAYGAINDGEKSIMDGGETWQFADTTAGSELSAVGVGATAHPGNPGSSQSAPITSGITGFPICQVANTCDTLHQAAPFFGDGFNFLAPTTGSDAAAAFGAATIVSFTPDVVGGIEIHFPVTNAQWAGGNYIIGADPNRTPAPGSDTFVKGAGPGVTFTGTANSTTGAFTLTGALRMTFEEVTVPAFNQQQVEWYLEGTYAEAAVIPVPAAVWLFGSGLLGLVGVARRKKSV